jgi:hypothetical protein
VGRRLRDRKPRVGVKTSFAISVVEVDPGLYAGPDGMGGGHGIPNTNRAYGHWRQRKDQKFSPVDSLTGHDFPSSVLRLVLRLFESIFGDSLIITLLDSLLSIQRLVDKAQDHTKRRQFSFAARVRRRGGAAPPPRAATRTAI